MAICSQLSIMTVNQLWLNVHDKRWTARDSSWWECTIVWNVAALPKLITTAAQDAVTWGQRFGLSNDDTNDKIISFETEQTVYPYMYDTYTPGRKNLFMWRNYTLKSILVNIVYLYLALERRDTQVWVAFWQLEKMQVLLPINKVETGNCSKESRRESQTGSCKEILRSTNSKMERQFWRIELTSQLYLATFYSVFMKRKPS